MHNQLCVLQSMFRVLGYITLGLLLTSSPSGFSDLPTALHIVMLLSRKGFLDIRILDRVLGSEGCIIILEWLLRNHCLSLLSREKSLVKPASRQPLPSSALPTINQSTAVAFLGTLRFIILGFHIQQLNWKFSFDLKKYSLDIILF